MTETRKAGLGSDGAVTIRPLRQKRRGLVHSCPFVETGTGEAICRSGYFRYTPRPQPSPKRDELPNGSRFGVPSDTRKLHCGVSQLQQIG